MSRFSDRLSGAPHLSPDRGLVDHSGPFLPSHPRVQGLRYSNVLSRLTLPEWEKVGREDETGEGGGSQSNIPGGLSRRLSLTARASPPGPVSGSIPGRLRWVPAPAGCRPRPPRALRHPQLHLGPRPCPQTLSCVAQEIRSPPPLDWFKSSPASTQDISCSGSGYGALPECDRHLGLSSHASYKFFFNIGRSSI